MSSMAAVNLVHELVDHAYDFEEILQEVEFVVIPVANPDGKEYSHTTVILQEIKIMQFFVGKKILSLDSCMD
jgi:murein tripeptide amidase MpaA